MSINHTSTELLHYGVKGMKWGVRKDDSSGKQGSGVKARYRAIRDKKLVNMTVKTRNGTKVNVAESQTAKPAAFFNALRKDGLAQNAAYKDFSLSVDGKKVGNASFEKVSDDELNLVWLGVKSSERGKGYATAVFDSAVQYGRAEGVKKLTLEVPGNAPDARHIYEKQGFSVDKKKTDAHADGDDDVWGGLTFMYLDLKDDRLSHSDLSEEEELELALTQTFPQFTGRIEAQIMGENPSDVVEHQDYKDLELLHYGVKGMKWGVRKDDSSVSKSKPKPKPKVERTPEEKRARNKKIAVGIAAGAAATTVATLSAVAIARGRKAAVAEVRKNASMSLMDLAVSTHKSAQPNYKTSSKRLDTRLYGEKAAKRIGRSVTRGTNLRDARVSEVKKKAIDLALNAAIGVAVSKFR